MKTVLVPFGMLMIVCAMAHGVRGGIINGDFETSDLTGWSLSAVPIDPTPFVGVVDSGGNSFVQFNTAEFDDGLFVATLEQTFTVEASEPFLRFDFSLPDVSADPTGTGSGPFFDTLFVSLDDGLDIFDLLLVDQTDALADPFGTAPGTVALGTPSDSFFDFGFSADMSSLAGSSITLFFDLINEDDGYVSVFDLDNVATARPPVIPEPSALIIWSLSGFGLVCIGRRRKTATAAA